MKYVQRRWGDTWWRLSTGVGRHYSAAVADDVDTHSTCSQSTLSGIR